MIAKNTSWFITCTRIPLVCFSYPTLIFTRSAHHARNLDVLLTENVVIIVEFHETSLLRNGKGNRKGLKWNSQHQSFIRPNTHTAVKEILIVDFCSPQHQIIPPKHGSEKESENSIRQVWNLSVILFGLLKQEICGEFFVLVASEISLNYHVSVKAQTT
jgi:hypothetical protein